MTTRTARAISRAFATAAAEGRPAIIPYVMAGYPSHDAALDVAEALVRGGADLLEIGMPFSDPLADGPTIQRAAAGALAAGTSTRRCLETVRALRERGVEVPLVLMGYVNPILRYGQERFCQDAHEAGADGLIVADLPPEEAGGLLDLSTSRRLDLIFLVAPTSDSDRIATVAAVATGFLYCVARVGVTGAGAELDDELPAFLGRVRASCDLPIAAGFGISTPAHVQALAPYVDGVVVASALIDALDAVAEAERPAAARAFVEALRGG